MPPLLLGGDSADQVAKQARRGDGDCFRSSATPTSLRLGIPASAIHALFHDSTPLSRHNDSPTVTGLTVGLSPFRYAWCAYVARLSAAGTYGRSTTMTASS
jgi:hypothetical protein